MSLTLEELRNLPTADLVERHDKLAENTQVGVRHYLDELARRDQAASAAMALRLTGAITGMTAVMLVTTVVNVLLFTLR